MSKSIGGACIPNYTRFALYLTFAASGFSALVLEVIWARKFALTFGTTLPAISIVAATFMAGLAIGSLLVGRRIDRFNSPLLLLALLEAGIALSALVFPFALVQVTDLYVAVSRQFSDYPVWTNAFRFLFSGLLLLPPTICMGGTLPAICSYFARKQHQSAVGFLYGANTFGAVLGVLGAGYWLLPMYGFDKTSFFAVIINLSAALLIFLLHKVDRGILEDVSVPALPNSKSQRSTYVLVAIAVTGACALAYQILWNRVLMLFLGTTGFAFSSILAVVLVGLSLGFVCAGLIQRRGYDLHRSFLLIIVLMALSVLATAPFYDRLSYLYYWSHEFAGGSWWFLSLLSFAITMLSVFPTMFLSGALLPLAVALQEHSWTQVGRNVGATVMANTSGAIIGSLAACFLLIPSVGISGSVKIVTGLNLFLGLFLYFRMRVQVAISKRIVCLLLPGLILLGIPINWDAGLMNAGVYVYPYRIKQEGGIEAYIEKFPVVEVFEGRDATVAIKGSHDSGELFMTINGKVDASTGRDMENQLLLGHLPLLVHKSPQSAMVIGLGGGMTLEAAIAHPLTKINCVEIASEVIEAASRFYPEGRRLNKAPGVTVVRNDARNQLLVHEDQYDVIVSEPSNPWQTGNANLFTFEFYGLVSKRLNSGGVFCQWLPLYDLTPESVRVVCRTFLKAFPYGLAFLTTDGFDLILLGSEDELVFDYLQMKDRFNLAVVEDDLRSLGLQTPGDLIGKNYLFSGEALKRFAGNGPLNIDAIPMLEFSYRDIFRANLEKNHAALQAALGKELLPLVNVGKDVEERFATLQELSMGFEKAGKHEIAAYLRNAAERLFAGAK